jgi:hypothetical protein
MSISVGALGIKDILPLGGPQAEEPLHEEAGSLLQAQLIILRRLHIHAVELPGGVRRLRTALAIVALVVNFSD